MEVLKDFNYAAYTANATITNLWVVSFAIVMNQDKWRRCRRMSRRCSTT
jgi:hypothetical protein